MTPAEMVTEINDYGFEDLVSARMYALLNQALREITQSEPWPWRETSVTLTFDGTNPNPSNSGLRISAPLAITNASSGYVMLPMRSEDFQKRFATGTAETGDPVYYYFDGHTLKFWRIPGSTQTLSMRYLQYQAVVTAASAEADVLLPERYHWMPIFLTLSRLYARDDDLDMAQFFLSEYERLKMVMKSDLWMRTQYDRPDTVKVMDDDDYYGD